MTRSVFGVLFCALVATGCGNTDGRSPTQLVLNSITGAEDSGGGGTTLISDPRVNGSMFADRAIATFSLIMRDQANPQPSDLSQVTITRYHVSYRRSDGQSIQGVDVPFAFDSAFTVTVAAGGTAKALFDIVRVTAKDEAPLRALTVNGDVIHAFADVTFYGQDLSGNDVSVSGTVGITFANFVDASK
jgi:hypothetical protein